MPAQVGNCLRTYFQFLFTNPLLVKFRAHRTSNLLCARECASPQPPVFLHPLTRPGESIQSLLDKLSVHAFIQRWSEYVGHLCAQKLEGVIEIYQDQISVKSGQGLSFYVKQKLK
jgi:hypothetical protein